jgi:DNA-binding response OmpR family regulator
MKKSILVIESSSVVRTILEFFLESEGFKVHTAAHGTEGLEKIHSSPYHLAIIGGDLPGLPGYEIIQEIRKVEHYKNLPILLITKGEPIDSEEFPGSGPLYLSELIEPEHLIRQVSQILDQS